MKFALYFSAWILRLYNGLQLVRIYLSCVTLAAHAKKGLHWQITHSTSCTKAQ